MITCLGHREDKTKSTIQLQQNTFTCVTNVSTTSVTNVGECKDIYINFPFKCIYCGYMTVLVFKHARFTSIYGIKMQDTAFCGILFSQRFRGQICFKFALDLNVSK